MSNTVIIGGGYMERILTAGFSVILSSLPGGKMKTNKITGLLSICFMIFFFSAVAFALTPEEILAKTDGVRGAPFDTFIMDVDVKSPQGSMSFKVYSKTGAGSLALFLKPVHQKGQMLLMKEPTLFFFAPGNRYPVVIDPAMRLKGDISNGDLLRLRWSKDYDAKQIGEDGKSYELELTAKNKSATFYRMEVLIEKDSFKPVRSKVYLQSGKLYKTIKFTGFKSFSGKLMSTDLTFIDHLKNEEESKITFSNLIYQEIPDNYFETAALPSLSKPLSEKWQ
jgi:hypothetical protein